MRVLLYVDISNLSEVDRLLGPGVDDGAVTEYLALTADGAPLVYTEDQKPGAAHFNQMALSCMGVTE